MELWGRICRLPKRRGTISLDWRCALHQRQTSHGKECPKKPPCDLDDCFSTMSIPIRNLRLCSHSPAHHALGLAFRRTWPSMASTEYSTDGHPYSLRSWAVFWRTKFLNESRDPAPLSPVL